MLIIIFFFDSCGINSLYIIETAFIHAHHETSDIFIDFTICNTKGWLLVQYLILHKKLKQLEENHETQCQNFRKIKKYCEMFLIYFLQV